MLSISELVIRGDRGDWYRFFRRSRCHETLETAMKRVERELEQSGAKVAKLADMYLAYDDREQELYRERAPLLRRDTPNAKSWGFF